jgi:hypothetical protein
MEFTSGISLAAIGELTHKEYKKKNIGILSAALMGISILVLGFLASAQLTRSTNGISSQNTQESHCRCGSKCSCGPACGCH